MKMTETTSEKAFENKKEQAVLHHSNQIFNLHTKRGQITFVFITILISCLLRLVPNDIVNRLTASFKSSPNEATCCNYSNLEPTSETNTQYPKYAIYGRSNSTTHLKHVFEVLNRMGLQQINIEDDWDLLWAHDYPFRIHSNILKSLKSHQKVNHFPGCGFITNKVDLCTSTLPYIPKAFKLPRDKNKFLDFSKSNPHKLFVQKHDQHRHIYIKSINEIDYKSNDTFIQEFIDNPFLVDGYKFDIGVYVIVTSVDPLRIYIYKGDVLFRYCPVKYYPFDPNNVDKYVVGDDYLPTWAIPSLSFFFNNLGFGMKDSFDAYVRNNNMDPEIIWNQVEDAIRSTVIAKEKFIVDLLNKYKSKNNFFEMMRFDLVIDADLKVYLMEANMSPNLSSAHFKPNSLLYEQILYSLFNLVGIGLPIKRNSFSERSLPTEIMISSDKSVAVQANVCGQNICKESCKPEQCHICLPCLTDDDKSNLHKAYREHVHRSDTKRIFPVPIKNISKYNITKETANLTANNRLMTIWFYEKCKTESSWCS